MAHDFEGHPAATRPVLGFIDLSHAATTKEPEDLIIPEGLPGLGKGTAAARRRNFTRADRCSARILHRLLQQARRAKALWRITGQRRSAFETDSHRFHVCPFFRVSSRSAGLQKISLRKVTENPVVTGTFPLPVDTLISLKCSIILSGEFGSNGEGFHQDRRSA
jgi:hypothetical protein